MENHWYGPLNHQLQSFFALQGVEILRMLSRNLLYCNLNLQCSQPWHQIALYLNFVNVIIFHHSPNGRKGKLA